MSDLLLRGGLIYDGNGTPPVRADVAITGDTITAIGDLSQETSGRVLDVSGLAVTPGFIDIHTHSDLSFLTNRPMRSSIAQGVTTELVGNCGLSIGLLTDSPAFTMERQRAAEMGGTVTWNRMGEFLGRAEDGGIACNVATLAGHGTIRKAVLGFENRPPDAYELRQMQDILAKALEDGAVGLSTGLEYLPGGYAEIDEQAALAQIAAEAGGFYATHLRNEGDTLIESVQEALTVSERAGIALQLSHHKSERKKNWGKVQTTLGMMRQARARGMDVLTDQYPYAAYMTGLAVIILPAWANDGSQAETTARLRDPETRARILAEMASENWDWDVLQIGIARNRRETQGLTLAELGRHEGKSPAESALDLMADEDGWVAAVHFAMSEEDIEAVLSDPHTMIGSDGVTNDPHGSGALSEGRPHPRAYGTFPRVLAHYVHDRAVISLSEAVRRMTALPAQRLKFTDRGRLAVGMKADITVFDPAKIRDCATFDDPHQYPVGIRHVIVNGRLAIDNGVQTEVLSGKVLRRA
jgi:N-acyl-D-amino-acid deacylase